MWRAGERLVPTWILRLRGQKACASRSRISIDTWKSICEGSGYSDVYNDCSKSAEFYDD